MSDPTKEYPPEYPGVKPGLDVSKLPVAGYGTVPEITESRDEAIRALKEQADALEQRYAQPNWFKVAAGFAKPQLGGFLASLGSAAGAMGEQQEAARAVMPTVARMRAEVAAQQAGLSAKTVQDRMWEKYQKDIGSGKDDPARLAEIIRYDPSSQTAIAAKEKLAAASSIAGTQRTSLGTTIEAQEAAAKYPWIDVASFVTDSQLANQGQQKEALIKAISSKGYYSPEDLMLKGVSELTNIANNLNTQFAEKSLENAKDAASLVDNASSQMQNLSMARYLASSPAIEKLLGLESGTNAVSALFNWISTSNDGDFSKLQTAARQLLADNPAAYSEFQILRKALAVNLATAREGIQNPSVASQNLLAQTNPDPRMTREAIIKLLDLQANDVNQTLGRARIMSSTRGPNGEQLDPNTLRQSPFYQSISRQAENRKKAILQGSFMEDRHPTFYNPYFEPTPEQKTQVPGQISQARQPASAPSAAKPPISLDAIKKALEQAKAANKNQP